jgi:hypothetical protein
MVNLKLSHDGSFGPLHVEEPVGVKSGPVQATVGLLWETVPLGGVAAGDEATRRITRRGRKLALSKRLRQRDAFIVIYLA